MIAFVLGHAAAGPGAAADGRRDAAATALADALRVLPFPPDRPVERWRDPAGGTVAAWAQHDAAAIGGVRHAAADGRALALFAGRPFRWADADADGDVAAADGREVLDARRLVAAGWDGLDGRWAAARAADGRLEVCSDALGAYPLYAAEDGGTWWVSNLPEALRRLPGVPGGDLDPVALAGTLGIGWPFDGGPWWAPVRRLPAGVPLTRGADGRRAEGAPLLDRARVAALPGAGWDPDRGAAVLVGALRALDDWPDRPRVVPVTGGRDSRVVLGAAVAAGLAVTTTTGGAPADPDVAGGRALAAAAGLPHTLLPADPHGSMWSDPVRAARVVTAASGGTAAVQDAAGFPLGPRPGPLPLFHSGQGGELARATYPAPPGGDPAGGLLRALLARRPGRPGLLSREGEALLADRVGAWVRRWRDAGAADGALADLLYLDRRMGTWAGPTHGCVEFVRDTTSPLWSARLLPDLLGAPRAVRAADGVHRALLGRLAPRLVDVPFGDGGGWPGSERRLAARARRARHLARRAAEEGRRRARRRPGRSATGPAADPFAPVLAITREAVAAVAPGHVAWSLLDRPRVEGLLAAEPAALDTMRRYHVWRLLQVFTAAGPPT